MKDYLGGGLAHSLRHVTDSEHGLACYVIKLNSKSFRLRSKSSVAFAHFKQYSSQRLRASQSQVARGGPIPGKNF